MEPVLLLVSEQAGAGVQSPAGTRFVVPLDAEPEEVEALGTVNVAAIMFLLRARERPSASHWTGNRGSGALPGGFA